MWTPKPSNGIVNSLGYIGEPISMERVPDVQRILFLGDSCTAGVGYYPDKTVNILNTRFGIKAEPLIAAAGGYTTFQGLDFLKDSIRYKPDILISYFGWNDHWVALGSGLPDNEFKEMTELQMFVHNASAKFRTYQLLHFMIYPPYKYSIKNTLSPQTKLQDILRFLRVPPENFVSNIREMINIAEENNAHIYFIAAPMGLHILETDQNHLLPSRFIPEVHLFYIYLLKKVAAEFPDVNVIDFNNTVFDKSLMMLDGIHLTAKGHNVIAEGIVKKLMETSKLEFYGAKNLPEALANL